MEDNELSREEIEIFLSINSAVMNIDFKRITDLLEIYKKNNDIEGIHYVLHIAISSNIVPMIELILNYLTLEQCNSVEQEHLSTAVRNGHIDIVKFLIEHGIDISRCNDEDFLYAAEYGYLEIVKYLDDKADYAIDLLEEALEQAAYSGHFKIVKFLLDILEEPKKNVAIRQNTIRNAVHSGHLKCTKYLVEYWDIDDLDWLKEEELDILLWGLLNGNIKFINWITTLLDISKSDIKDTNEEFMRDNDINVESFIIKRLMYLESFDISIINTIIFDHCCRRGYIDGVKYLLAKGIDIHTDNEDGLRMAVIFNHLDLAQYLILKGANVDIAMENLSECHRKKIKKLSVKPFKGKLNEKTERICFICHEDMNVEKELLIQCNVCSKCVHLNCQNKWKPQCIFCRT